MSEIVTYRVLKECTIGGQVFQPGEETTLGSSRMVEMGLLSINRKDKIISTVELVLEDVKPEVTEEILIEDSSAVYVEHESEVTEVETPVKSRKRK